ncbi:hypothetical protein L3V83_08670 [Thiotrichales bacterium 19X7-9]|nr:hypothetical protein [Thiotrichales bacterium 19X7-9]
MKKYTKSTDNNEFNLIIDMFTSDTKQSIRDYNHLHQVTTFHEGKTYANYISPLNHAFKQELANKVNHTPPKLFLAQEDEQQAMQNNLCSLTN